jgi:predicted Zn-dependent protease
MSDTSLQDQIDDATFDFTLGEAESAISKLYKLSEQYRESFGVWLALTEVYFAEGHLDAALKAAERAHALCPNDIHINTSLSRIWVERGDKERAEHFGAQARMLGWKDELKTPPTTDAI